MKAVILAGGLGTRLRPLTFSRPKPMIPLLNEPVTQHILSYLKKHGVDDIVITTNYLREHLERHFGTGEAQGLTLHYPVEETPLGTAGCVKNIADQLTDTFVVIQGDNITDIDLTKVIAYHRKKGAQATVALLPVEDTSQFGIAEVADDGRIKQFLEKPGKEESFSNLANVGVYVLEPDVLDYVPANAFFDFSRDLFPALVEEEAIYGYHASGFWVDVGQPAGYTVARDWLMGRLETRISESATVTPDFEGPLVVGDGSTIAAGVRIHGPVVVGRNVTVEAGAVLGPNTVVGDSVTVKADARLHGSVVFDRNAIGVDSNLADCIIAEAGQVGASSRIGFNVVVGHDVALGQRVSVVNDSRIWPGQTLSDNAVVNGTLRKFIQLHDVRRDPEWSLRTVSPEEAFYFNLTHQNNVLYTGFKAKNLEQFSHILERVDASSIIYHMREQQNDFRDWLAAVISDPALAQLFEQVKGRQLAGEALRGTLVNQTKLRVKNLTRYLDTKKAYL